MVTSVLFCWGKICFWILAPKWCFVDPPVLSMCQNGNIFLQIYPDGWSFPELSSLVAPGMSWHVGRSEAACFVTAFLYQVRLERSFLRLLDVTLPCSCTCPLGIKQRAVPLVSFTCGRAERPFLNWTLLWNGASCGVWLLLSGVIDVFFWGIGHSSFTLTKRCNGSLRDEPACVTVVIRNSDFWWISACLQLCALVNRCTIWCMFTIVNPVKVIVYLL